MELAYTIQHYDWGKKGSQSKVATLHSNLNSDVKIDSDLPYAELWIGTHVNGPSFEKRTGEPLSSVIERNPQYLGNTVLEKFGQLPFLFKILSVNKALSIQAHPSKKVAEELHKKFPDIYKDPNHKPELAIALTPFEALCGFRQISEIITFSKEIPELRNVIGSNIPDNANTDWLKSSFKAVLTCPKDTISSELTKMLERFKTLDDSIRQKQLADLVEKLYSQFPNDVGCFVVYFLNYIKLAPFEAIYLGANEPHAYIYGDCVECMACSDNVVRAGLTPKLIDVETLCSMLTYEESTPKDKLFQPIIEDENCQIFKPPVPDFAVIQIQIYKDKNIYQLPPRNSASTLLVLSGAGKTGEIDLIPGTAIFLSSGQTLEITIAEDLLIYQAIANI